MVSQVEKQSLNSDRFMLLSTIHSGNQVKQSCLISKI